MRANEFKPGSLVELGGVKFIVLDTDDSDNTLYLYATAPQDVCSLKETDTYQKSELYDVMISWFHEFIKVIGTKYLVMAEWDEDGEKFMDLCAPLPAYDAKKYLEFIKPYARGKGYMASFLLGHVQPKDVEPPIENRYHKVAGESMKAGVRPALWINADIFIKE